MRLILGVSASLTRTDLPNLRLRLWALEVRIWRKWEWPRFTFPLAVFLKRLAAPLWVFIFGIDSSVVISTQQSALRRCRYAQISANCCFYAWLTRPCDDCWCCFSAAFLGARIACS